MKKNINEKNFEKEIEYKGYIGEFGIDEDVGLYGRVIGLQHTYLTFQGNTAAELKADFEDMIDEYIDLCKKRNVEPEKPYKGSFNVRVGTELHVQLAKMARLQKTSINSLVVEAINHYVHA